jgi:predicted RND superfamily exporter protein
MLTDLARLVPLVTVVVLLCLFFSFKNLEGTLLPLITVVFSAIWTIGLMALTGSRFTVVSSCLPIVLIAVGSAYGIHVVNHYYEDLRRRTGELTRKTHTELVAESLKKVIVPVMLAGITTVAGFISNVASPVVPLKGFSIFSALGVVFSLVMSVVLIPALLTVKPRLPSTKGSMNEAGEVVAAEGTAASSSRSCSARPRRRKLHVAAYAAVLAIPWWGSPVSTSSHR